MNDQATGPIADARRLAALAGIALKADRESALAAGLEATRRISGALARQEYGQTEPASRFRPPGRSGT